MYYNTIRLHTVPKNELRVDARLRVSLVSQMRALSLAQLPDVNILAGY